MQLTNIIRDVGADIRIGRVYLPQEDLETFGVTADDLREGRMTDGFAKLMAYEAARAKTFYQKAWAAFPMADARSLVAAEIMGRIYRALLGEVEARGFAVFGERITVPAQRKVVIALRCWAAARLNRPALAGSAA